MRAYLLKYIMQFIPVLFIISSVIFALLYLTGDPVALMISDQATPEQIAELRESLGLNRPFYVQYGIYMLNLLQGDFGISYVYREDALTIVLERLPSTLLLGSASIAFAIVISVPLGVLSAIKKNTFVDLLISGFSVVGKAIPNFWQAIMLILLFSITLQLFPVSGEGSWKHLVLPAITLGSGAAAEIARLIRSSMLDVLSQDYIRTAKSKGVSNAVVYFRHAFRNCLLPVVTVMATQVAVLFGGAVITETVFAWPGMGQLLVKAISVRDMSVVQAVVFVSAMIIILMNFLADVAYRWIDPRIKYE
ncbi:ABC transporter permease [Paenibacillus antri]|uniref:ABC transporter permease n=1 Tax=Paenibacillus antri TaxID=2582848 RepID=A0A5R9GLM8_9BACL|nr:ABC transporter permease [Paenibacillus antri]TLS54043.1 ABC transporter permease [Paenibacillus antri]